MVAKTITPKWPPQHLTPKIFRTQCVNSRLLEDLNGSYSLLQKMIYHNLFQTPPKNDFNGGINRGGYK